MAKQRKWSLPELWEAEIARERFDVLESALGADWLDRPLKWGKCRTCAASVGDMQGLCPLCIRDEYERNQLR